MESNLSLSNSLVSSTWLTFSALSPSGMCSLNLYRRFPILIPFLTLPVRVSALSFSLVICLVFIPSVIFFSFS